MRTITLEELLEAGCHFGHQVNRHNPKARDFVFEARSNIHIINLEKTHEGLTTAAEYLRDLAEKNGSIIVVGTRRQAKQVVLDEVKRAKEEGAKGLFSVTSRWIGGTLTNFAEVSKNFKRLIELNEFLVSSKKDEYTKREIVLFEREKVKLEDLYGGVINLSKTPDALVIIGTQLETTAVRESLSNNVTTVGIVDTNADPSVIDYPIPANDDAVGSIKLITSYLMDAWIEGSKKGQKQVENDKKNSRIAAEKEEAKMKKEKAAAINRQHNS